MKKTLLPASVKRFHPSMIAPAILLVATISHSAQPYGQVPPSSLKARKGSYAPIPPSYASSSGGAITRPKGSASAGPLETRVVQLAQNDQRQDIRLRHLERDVSSLKPGAGRSAPTHWEEPAPAAPQGKIHIVRPGDTLWRIAAKYSTSINAIRVANHISGDTVAVGQSLMIPSEGAPSSASASSGVHVVSAGETFSGIAQRYRVSQDALAQANTSAYPDRLLVGERLVIPGARKATVPTYTSTPAPSSSMAGRSPGHVVQPGESLGVIAKKYGISTASLAAANKLKNPNVVEVGQRLSVPARGPATAPISNPPSKMVKNSSPSADRDIIPLPGAGLPASPRAPIASAAPAPAMPKPFAAPSEPPLAPKSSPVEGARRGVVAYRLEPGDDLNTVANMFSTTPAKIRDLNLLAANAELKAGDEVVVPALGPISVD